MYTKNRNKTYFINVLEDLSEHFGQFGEIENINVKVDAATGRARGFAFIVYKTMEGLDNVSTPFSFISFINFYFYNYFGTTVCSVHG